MATQTLITIKALRHSYGTREALRGVSFEVACGEIFGLLGPNGSGKSTLFGILSTLFRPTSGEIRVGGFALAQSANDVRRQIGVVFQSPSLDDKLTVFENLRYQGYLYGLGGNALKKRCHELLEELGVSDRARDLVGKLSGGLKRRVEIAKGLLHGPKLLLLDEPSTGLDPGARVDLWKYLRALRDQEKVTVMVTTHMTDESENCDRIAILSDGELVCLGAPDLLKGEIGADVLEIQTNSEEQLAHKIEETFGIKCVVLKGSLQMEHEHAAGFVAKLVETFPGVIQAVTFRRPTLEDVYLHKTGQRFWSGGGEQES
ncbi:MAG: ABC transporter ATP-binding protein [Candidatus Omnitrophota bacterium]|nr:ABC transporter ATP-binding protein [Candidatus Omnitrophota bacterium]